MSLFKNILFFVLFISLIINIMNFDFFKEYFKNWWVLYSVIIVGIISPIFVALLLNSKKNNKLKKDTIKIFDDNEYFGKEYNLYIDKIKEIISSIDKFFSIGVFGKWGIGKSSFLKNLEKQLTKENYDVIYLNVWELENTANILNEVKKEFDNILFKYRPFLWLWYHIKSIFSKNYFSIINNYFIKTNFNTDFAFSSTLREAQEDLNYYLNKATDKIVLIIDEIDRLPKEEEILNVFKIIRYITPFNNVVVISAMDIDKIKIKDKEFIHKIFNLKFELGEITKNDLIKCLKIGMYKIVNSFKSQRENLQINDVEFYKIIEIISTYREIKNILNDMNLFLHIFLKQNINNIDYINIKIIWSLIILKNLNFKLYDIIINNENSFEELFNKKLKNEDKYLNILKLNEEKLEEYKKEILLLDNIMDFTSSSIKSDLNLQTLYIYKYNRKKDYMLTHDEFVSICNDFKKFRIRYNNLYFKNDRTEFLNLLIDFIYKTDLEIKKICNETQKKKFISNILKIAINNRKKIDFDKFIGFLIRKEIYSKKYFNSVFQQFFEIDNKTMFEFFTIFYNNIIIKENKYFNSESICERNKNNCIEIFIYFFEILVNNIEILNNNNDKHQILGMFCSFKKEIQSYNNNQYNKLIESIILKFIKYLYEDIKKCLFYELSIEFLKNLISKNNLLLNYLKKDIEYTILIDNRKQNLLGKELKEKLKD